MEVIFILQNWSVIFLGSKYTAPECRAIGFAGNVYHNPQFNDGDFINTSAIESFVNEVFTTYSGSKYTLGKVDPAYEALYPDAYNKIVESVLRKGV